MGALRWPARVASRRRLGESLPKGYGTLLYRNPEDPRLWVPKLVGIGWTLNFAHPTAWLVLGLLLLPALVVLISVIVIPG